MDIKQELNSWMELASSFGYEMVPEGNAAWRLDFCNDLSVRVQIYNEPDEMILSGAETCMAWLRNSFYCVVYGEDGILLTKEQVRSRLAALCEHQLKSEIEILPDSRNVREDAFRAAKVALMKSRCELVSESGTEEECMSRRRKGQDLLANYLYEKYGKCFITGIKRKPLLVASHIKPWADSKGEQARERLDEDNVLLLSVGYDKLFDRGYISFNDDGCMVVCKDAISDDELRLLGVDVSSHVRLADVYLTLGRKKFLRYHRDNIFGKKCV